MEMHWRNPDRVALKWQRKADEAVERLARDHRDIIDVWIELDQAAQRERGFETAKIRAEVRDGEVVVHEQDDTTELALSRALDAFERAIRKRRERAASRPLAGNASAPLLGVVDTTFPGEDYGFIITEAGEQVYFHRNAVRSGLAFDDLEDGQHVALGVEEGEKGPQAIFVAPPPPGMPQV